MGIQARRNLYRGVNPHLNSELQTPATEIHLPLWHSFHMSFIGHISNALNGILPPDYVATIQPSMQAPDETIDIIFLDSEEDFLHACVILLQDKDQPTEKQVVHIEFVSPANKPGRQGRAIYVSRRLELLKRGLSLIEVDFAHEQPPLFEQMPIYPDEDHSHPYSIILCDPRPSFEGGRVDIYGCQIDDRLPTIPIPLVEDQVILVDFDKIYQETYWNGRWGKSMKIVDYSQPPVRFLTYSPADQMRIQVRMAAITEAHERGENLEHYEP